MKATQEQRKQLGAQDAAENAAKLTYSICNDVVALDAIIQEHGSAWPCFVAEMAVAVSDGVETYDATHTDHAYYEVIDFMDTGAGKLIDYIEGRMSENASDLVVEWLASQGIQ